MSVLFLVFLLVAGSLFSFGHEFVNPTKGVNVTHFTGEEGVASGTDVYLELGKGRTNGKSVATGTSDLGLMVFRMDIGFHTV